LLRRDPGPAADIAAKTIAGRFEWRERLDVGLRLRSVHAARREGDLHVVPGCLCGLLDRGRAAENDQVGQRDFLAGRPGGLALRLAVGERLTPLPQVGRLVALPVLWRREADARAVGPAALVGTAERGGRGPGRRDQL